MAELGRIAAICLIGIVLTLLLEKNHPELAILLAIAVCAGMLFFYLGRVKIILSVLEQMAQAGGISSDLLEPLLKTVGIALISHTGAELCRDAKQGAVATVVETAGAFSAIIVSIPLLKAVWELLLEIPYGRTTTYGAITQDLKAAGISGAAQAVGGAVGHNPISILIPCHRVVGTNGSLTGYAGGIEKKQFLLELEGVDLAGLHVPKKGAAL